MSIRYLVVVYASWGWEDTEIPSTSEADYPHLIFNSQTVRLSVRT